VTPRRCQMASSNDKKMLGDFRGKNLGDDEEG
jgi:hypothetical protein